MKDLCLEERLRSMGASESMLNSKTVKMMEQILEEYTDIDQLKIEHLEGICLKIVERLEAEYNQKISDIDYRYEKNEETWTANINHRVGEIETNAKTFAENIESVDELTRRVTAYQQQVLTLQRCLDGLNDRFIKLDGLYSKAIKEVEDEVEQQRSERVITNSQLKENLAFSKEMLHVYGTSVKEIYGDNVPSEVMTAIVQATSYTTWRGLDPKNSAALNARDSFDDFSGRKNKYGKESVY